MYCTGRNRTSVPTSGFFSKSIFDFVGFITTWLLCNFSKTYTCWLLPIVTRFNVGPYWSFSFVAQIKLELKHFCKPAMQWVSFSVLFNFVWLKNIRFHWDESILKFSQNFGVKFGWTQKLAWHYSQIIVKDELKKTN